MAQIEAIDEFRIETWRWQSLMRKPRTPTLFSERRTSDAAYLRWIRDLWQRRAARAERQAQNPPRKAAWLCIHRYERNPAQGWRTQTGNGYYGGLQMDASFQRTYGPAWARRAFGESAHLWPASVQMSAAIQAWTSRGFGPWPTTRRMCGL